MKYYGFVFLILFPILAFSKGFGIATLVKGQPTVQNANGQKKTLVRGDKVYESDTIITSASALVRLAMMDTNIIDIYPNSKLYIKEYIYNPKENQKNVSLEVSEGKIKSTVRQKYDNDQNKYNVITPVIVAGVRGTIFSATHEKQSGRSEVLTHEGHVMVGRLEGNLPVKEFFSVRANQKLAIDQNTERPTVQKVPQAEIERLKEEDKAADPIKVDSQIRDRNPGSDNGDKANAEPHGIKHDKDYDFKDNNKDKDKKDNKEHEFIDKEIKRDRGRDFKNKNKELKRDRDYESDRLPNSGSQIEMPRPVEMPYPIVEVPKYESDTIAPSLPTINHGY